MDTPKFSIEKKICKQCKKNPVEKEKDDICEDCKKKNIRDWNIFKGGIRL